MDIGLIILRVVGGGRDRLTYSLFRVVGGRGRRLTYIQGCGEWVDTGLLILRIVGGGGGGWGVCILILSVGGGGHRLSYTHGCGIRRGGGGEET